MVLEGEQHLQNGNPRFKIRHRKKGDYALAGSDALPHDEWGGAGWYSSSIYARA